MTVNTLVWSEGTAPEDVYPDDINGALAEFLENRDEITTRAVSIEDESQGVPPEALEWADAITWWGHLRHDDVTDETVDRVEAAVREDGVGFLCLHSGHIARPFTRLIDDDGGLGEVRTVEGESEQISVEAPSHPIADGVDDFVIDQVEMFGEPYGIPEPETLVLRSEFSEGGWFRSGVTFQIDAGRVAYLRPGHEEFPIYRNHRPLQQVIANAVEWVAGAR